MKFLLAGTLTACIVSCFGHYKVVEDNYGNQVYLVPVGLHRQRRQTTIDVQGSGNTGRVTLRHTGAIFKNNAHEFRGGGSVSKQFNPSGPTSFGGNLKYNHLRSGSGLSGDVSHTPRFGTDLNLQGNINLLQRRNSCVEAFGGYQRNFRGPNGTGRPNYHIGVSAKF